MLLKLRNIGKIYEADVKIDGITVIAGENNTGKSTVGKTLYSVFNSFYQIEKQVFNSKAESIQNAIEKSLRSIFYLGISKRDFKSIANDILKSSELYIDKPEFIKQLINEYMSELDEKYVDEENIDNMDGLVERINDILKLSDDDIIKTILKNKLNYEFNGQINNIYSESKGSIELTIQNKTVSVKIHDDEVDYISDTFDLNTEAIYIDDPFVLDDLRTRTRTYQLFNPNMDHREHLKSKLFSEKSDINVVSEILTTAKLENIFSKINNICSGEMTKGKGVNFAYKEQGTDKLLDIRNISAGLKTFVIIKTLLLNGSLEENGTIILDEPEIHLHPEWQLSFAELIVLIQKEFGMHILINTHSPYFLNAIEVYSAKYNIVDKCNYYMAILSNSEKTSTIEDVTKDIEKIYKKLARPFQDLENERYSYD